MKSRKITIVGCGPGDVDYVTPAAQRAIEAADVLVGAPRLLASFGAVHAERIEVGADIAAVLKKIATFKGRKKLAVLVTGDPGVCSLAQPVIKKFGRDACEVIPGISSVQIAFARLGLDWFDARLVTAHSEKPKLKGSSLASADKIAVLAGNEANLPWIFSLVETLRKSHAVFVCENLTLADESVRQVRTQALRTMKLASRAIVLLIRKGLMK